MGSILQPGYLRWDGFKYVIDTGAEIVGPPGPPGINGVPGAAGAAGADGAPGPAGDASLIYQPGGTASGNVYTSWTALMTKRATTPEVPMTIYIDDTFVSPAVIDTGTWELNKNTAIVGIRGPVPIVVNNSFSNTAVPVGSAIPCPLNYLQIPAGALLLDPSSFSYLAIEMLNGSGTWAMAPSTFTFLDLEIRDCWVIANGNNPTAIDLQRQAVINLYGNTIIFGDYYGNYYVFGSSNFSTFYDADYIINLYDSAVISSYAISLGGGG